ncbi:MAG: NADH-quinone oxidoreductase subunit N [candidate division KSB1 bacterium]|nr:NADH-quinone oxidoreductase subunit N [candidate division KSB1 bacterium]
MMPEIPSLNWLVVSPHLAIAGGAIVLLLIAVSRYKRSYSLAAGTAVASLGLSCALALYGLGSTASSFAHMVTGDPFSTAFNLVFLLGAMITVFLSANRLEQGYVLYADYFALILLAVLGMMFLASGANLVMIFLGLETLSISLYVLAGQRRDEPYSLESALKYFLLGSFASAFFLFGVALMYGSLGSLDLAAIARAGGTDGLRSNALFAFGLLMLLIGFGFKIALVPFHMWTPDVYQGAPAPVAGFMATGSKAAAFAALVRLLLGAVGQAYPHWPDILWILAVLTMTVGNVVAIVQDNVKRMLAYSSIAHAGYVAVGVVASNELSAPSVIFYLLAYTLMNLGAFGVLAALAGPSGERQHIQHFAGLGYRRSFVGAAMALFMFSLAGIPPTAGFMAKFYVFSAALKSGYLWLVILGVLNSMISVYYYLRVVVYLYMREPEQKDAVAKPGWAVSLGLAVCAAGVVWFGVFPGSALDLLRQVSMALQ